MLLCYLTHCFSSPSHNISGTNKFASQKGMRIGGRRYGADLTSGLSHLASHGIIPLQSG